MSPTRVRLPATTTWAVAAVGLVAAGVVAVAAPVAGLAALAGGLVGLGARGLGTSLRGHAVGSAVALAGVVGCVGALWIAVTRGVGPTGLAVPMLVLGGSTVFASAGGVPSAVVRRGPTAGAYAALAAGGLAGASAVGGYAPTALSAWLAGTATGSVALAACLVCVLGALGVLAIPAARIARPAAAADAVSTRNTVAGGIGLLGVLVVVGYGVAQVADPAGAFAASLAGTTSVRLLLVGAGLLAGGVLAVSGFLRLAHVVSAFGGFEHIAVFGGAAAGLLGTAATVTVVSSPVAAGDRLPALFAATAVACVGVAVAVGAYNDWIRAGRTPGVTTVVALSLLAVGLVAGVRDATGWTAGPGAPHLAALAAIAASTFAYRAGRVGRGLSRAVGRDQATRRPQLIHLGWTGAVTGLGLLVATVGFWLASAVAPTLSVPAAAGVVGGLAALATTGWLLLR